jgi:hypothetical protein
MRPSSPERRRRPFVLGLLVAAALAAGSARADEAARITEQAGQWELAYGLVYYRVFGKVENASKKPLRYVKLRLELLDKDGKPVLERVGFNQRAEALGEQETEGYQEKQSFEERLATVKPLAPGETDLFRIGISKDDIPKQPKFRSYRVKIMEAKP